jgi:prepilin signal peptidase PulO-like enzyme (type II secretory pathway)
MSSIVSTLLFLFGLAVGSLLNVIALRYNLKNKLLTASVALGRSHCRHCQNQLHWYELIPVVSFLVQGGKCRNCRGRLLIQYPVVEIITGFLFVFIPIRLADIYHLWNATTSGQLPLLLTLSIIWAIAISTLILVFLVDLKLFVIPNQMNFLLAFLGVVVIAVQGLNDAFGLTQGSFLGHHALIFGFRDNIWINHIFGAVLGLAIFGLIAFIGRGRAMGWGDVKLIGALGLLFGWPDVLIIMFLSFVIGAIVSIFILVAKKKTMKDVVPFGPFIAISAGIVFFFGVGLMGGYFNLFNFI